MKLGIDLGNKTFTVMRINQDGIEPVPNISTQTYGESQESYPAIFTYEDERWLLSNEQEEQSTTNVMALTEQDWQALGLTREEGLTGILRMIREIIQRNDPGKPIEEVVCAVADAQDAPVLQSALLQAGWPADGVQLLPETIAALIGSGIDNAINLIGTTRTVLVLEGKVHALVATVYTVTVTKGNDTLHADIHELSRATVGELGGAVLEQMLAARAQQIAAEAGVIDMEQTTALDWANFVDYIKDLFLVDDVPFIAGDFRFDNGTTWEEPEELSSDEMYAVFRGQPFMLDGVEQIRHIEDELRQFIHSLCDDGGITTTQIQEIILAGGTFRLPFWRTTVAQLFPKAHVVKGPDNIAETGIVGRGCANYLAWQHFYKFTYKLQKRSEQYIGIGFQESMEVKFKPLVALKGQKMNKSAAMLLKVEADKPLFITVYEGPQTEDLAACKQIKTLRFYHSALQQKLNLDHVAFYITVDEQGNAFAELQRPYTEKTILKEALFSDRAKEGQLND